MNSEHLIRMANQIGTFFESQPDRNEALEGIAIHIKKFWEPRMRTELLAVLEGSCDMVNPFVQEALKKHRTLVI